MGIIAIRDVDQDTFQEFKATAVRRGLKIGQALTLAMENFMSQQKRGKFTSLKPTDWGKGTENISQEVDKILYGT